jgi:hypothetical protein
MSSKRNICIPKIDNLETEQPNNYVSETAYQIGMNKLILMISKIIITIIIIIICLCIVIALSFYNYIKIYLKLN